MPIGSSDRILESEETITGTKAKLTRASKEENDFAFIHGGSKQAAPND